MGKNIKYFLMDGVAKGRVKCTLANWTGISYKVPRTLLEKCKDREDFKKSGVYFLFGVSDTSDDLVVYVGQAGSRKNGDGIYQRLIEHKQNPDKDYWTEAVMFTTADNSFGPTEISYLENHFCTMAMEAHRCIVKNGNEPSQGNVTEEKESELEEFIEYAKIVMGVLGYNIFEPLTSRNTSNNSTQVPVVKYYLNRRGADAQGILNEEGFVVLSGSKICKDETPSCPNYVKESRTKYAKDLDDNGVLQKDILFKSPSGAACFVMGASANGNTEWKTADGMNLGNS